MRMYSEIVGIGLSFNGDGEESIEHHLLYAMEQALLRSNVKAEELDFVFYNSTGCTLFDSETIIMEFLEDKQIPILCFNDRLGYAESFSCLNHLYLAADAIYHSQSHHVADEIAVTTTSPMSIFEDKQLKKGMVISSSINGNNTAIVLSSVN